VIAAALTFEIVAALRRGWSRLQLWEKPVYRAEKPLRYWTNIAVHAVMAVLGAMCVFVIGR